MWRISICDRTYFKIIVIFEKHLHSGLPLQVVPCTGSIRTDAVCPAQTPELSRGDADDSFKGAGEVGMRRKSAGHGHGSDVHVAVKQKITGHIDPQTHVVMSHAVSHVLAKEAFKRSP